MDFDLTRLGPRNFEHAVQALLRATLSGQPDVVDFRIFGDGKDGGREASWRGQSQVIEASKTWSGYSILQAKFRERPGNPARDLAWLSGQIKTEFEDWINKSRGEKPRNLLFATNIVLSSVAQSGGVDTIDEIIQGRLDDANRDVAPDKRLTLDGWAVWHFDTICRLLDQNPKVRATYGHMITAGDVLGQLANVISGSATSLGPTIHSQLSSGLRDDQMLRIQQFNAKMALGEVAVDLPCIADNGTKNAILTTLIKHGDNVLRRDVWDSSTDGPAHCVIVGGPGQGKSTIGQLLCQIYRLELLRERPESMLSESSSIALTAVGTLFRKRNLPRPMARRWPYLVPLGKYADRIADGGSVSLIRYIADTISSQLGDPVSAEQIRDWLAGWPWLLVLDGLDEVPSAAARQLLQQRIIDFMDVAAEYSADVMIVATTRPQGYDDGFSASIYNHCYLERLDSQRALEYGNAIISALYSDSPTTLSQMTDSLRRALSDPDTEKLMSTPLQVMIMTLILDRHNRVPADRYRLFDTYYQVIYERETQKPGALAQLLGQHENNIRRLHEEVGLELHYRNSQPGESAAAIPRRRLTQLAVEGLREDGFSADAAREYAEKFAQATFNRLVLLVPASGEEDVQFEVRSLQEYMAARWIADCPENEIPDRLAALVPSQHWRHPWVLAAEQLMGRRWIREAILGVLRSADAVNPTVSGLTLPGANRALDLLEADVSLSTPTITRSLVAHALELLSRPLDSSQHRRLAEVLASAAKDSIVSTQIRESLKANLDARGGALPATISVLEQLQQRTGPLSAWARLRIGSLREKAKTDSEVAICLAQLSAGGSIHIPGPADSGEPISALAFAPDAPEVVRNVLQQLSSLPTVVVEDNLMPHPNRFGGRGQVESLMLGLKDEDLAAAVRALPLQAWPFAAILQSALREREMLAVVTPPGAGSIQHV